MLLFVACSRGKTKPESCGHALMKQSTAPLASEFTSAKPVHVTSRRVVSEDNGFDGYGERKLAGDLGPFRVEWGESLHRGLAITSGAKLTLYHPDCKSQPQSVKIDVSIDSVSMYRVRDLFIITSGNPEHVTAFKMVPALGPSATAPP